VPLPESLLANDLKSINEDNKTNKTTKEALIDARIGQGKFRSDVLKLWGNCCAVTSSQTVEAIRASHIKPWRISTNDERLNPSNGLPLVASLDALFDAGFISFDDSGCLVISSKLSASERLIYGLSKKRLKEKPSAKTLTYLHYHRTKVFRN
jgi:putative restriction endonuclease